jgi:hypothetical protein
MSSAQQRSCSTRMMHRSAPWNTGETTEVSGVSAGLTDAPACCPLCTQGRDNGQCGATPRANGWPALAPGTTLCRPRTPTSLGAQFHSCWRAPPWGTCWSIAGCSRVSGSPPGGETHDNPVTRHGRIRRALSPWSSTVYRSLPWSPLPCTEPDAAQLATLRRGPDAPQEASISERNGREALRAPCVHPVCALCAPATTTCASPNGAASKRSGGWRAPPGWGNQ